jgi:acylglycerol lipase
MRNIYPGVPLFVGGQSLGGLTAYHMSLRHPEWFKGAVLLTPAIVPAIQHSNKIQALVNILQIAAFLLPNDARVIKVEVENTCRNPAAIQDLKADPLYQKRRLKLKTILTILSAQESTPLTFG